MHPARESDLRVLFKPISECGEGGCHARVWLPAGVSQEEIDVVLMFHGGGFGFGQDSDVPGPEVDYLLARGIVVVSAQYRLAPQYVTNPLTQTRYRLIISARFPQIVDDLCDAYAWTWSDLVRLVPGARAVKAVAVEGWSAGATSSSLLAAFRARRGLPKPAALHLHYGCFDFNTPITATTEPEPYDMAKLLAEPVSTGHPLAEGRVTPPSTRVRWLREMMYNDELPLVLYPEGTTRPVPPTYNPVDLVDADFPPSFVLVATKDQLIPVKHSYDFIDKLKTHGVEHMVAEADMLHGCSENHPTEQKDEYDRWFEGAIRPGLDWVVERLRASV